MKSLFALALVASFSLLVGCGGGDSDTQPPSSPLPEEGLSIEDLKRIDAAPDSFLPENEVILPDGQSLLDYANSRGITPNVYSSPIAPPLAGTLPLASSLPLASDPEQKRKDVITLMLRNAHAYACRRSNTCPDATTWVYDADNSDPINKPAQNGLTYIWGGKNPYVRTLPQDGCPQMTYGMDCSGLVYRIATATGISLPPGNAYKQGKSGSWTIPKDWRLEMKQVKDGSVEAGDIVGWNDHIGIADSSVIVISSTGGRAQCDTNIKPPRGPRPLLITTLKPTQPTSVLRLSVMLAGVYTGRYSITCAECDGGHGETGYGTITVTVESDLTFSSVAVTEFSSNVNNDHFGSNPGFSGTVSPSGGINASSNNNSNGCLHFFAAPYTTGQISSSGLMTVNYSQPAQIDTQSDPPTVICHAAVGTISANAQ